MTRPAPVLLLQEDDELRDVAAVLQDLQVEVETRRAAEGIGDPGKRELVVASGEAALALPADVDMPVAAAVRMVVGEPGAGPLRDRLRELGFDTLVRRPLPAEALRLLLLRALYRGPERRRAPRVPVGVAVRYRAPWLWRSARLVDLSSGGARLLVSRPVRLGRRIRLEVSDPAEPGRPLRLAGRVLRCNALAPTDPTLLLALAFDAGAAEDRVRLDEIVAAHGEAMSGATPLSEPGTVEPVERRGAPRVPYARRVVTLGEEAAQVVMGRDLSRGGMRIERQSGLAEGQRVSLALHGASLPVPVVVRAVVARDDGVAGLVLQFDALSPHQAAAVDKLVGEVGAIEALGGTAPGSAVVARLVRPAS